MKKIFAFIMAAAFCLTGAAKTADEVINEIEKATSAQVVRFNKEMIAMQMGKSDKDDIKELLNYVDNGCVLIIEDSDKAKSDTFNNTVAGLDSVYEPVVTVFDSDDRVKVLGRAEGDILKEVVVAVSDNEDCVMVYITGSIPKDKIGQLINNKTISF